MDNNILKNEITEELTQLLYGKTSDDWERGYDTAIRECIIKVGEYFDKKEEWIPCSERLPTEEECKQGNGLFFCIVVKRNGYGVKEIVPLLANLQGWFIDNGEVVAWMPLPSYKGE